MMSEAVMGGAWGDHRCVFRVSERLCPLPVGVAVLG